MDITKINQILLEAPSIISYRAEQENKFYAQMITLHENYKQLRAQKYLETKAKSEASIKDIEYMLDSDTDLCRLKSEELQAEIDYRKWRADKDKAVNHFEGAKQLSYNIRCEMRSLSDTIPERS